MTVLGLRRHSRGLGLSPHRRRAGSAAPPGIVQDGLVAEWRFDDGSGTTLTDYSGNGRHGELQGGTETPTWTAQGLSFDGGDGVFLNSIPAVHGIDLVFRPGSPISRGIGRQDVLGQGIDNGLAFGDCVLDFTDEIMTLKQEAAFGYAADHRRAWNHASETISAGWHLLQLDVRAAPDYWNLLLDGVNKANVTANTPQPFNASNWAIGRARHFGGLYYAGEIAYLIFYGAPRSDQQQGQNRAALTAILAARGITLP